MTFNEKRCKSRNQIISEPFAMRVIFMNVKEVIRKECNVIDYCQKAYGSVLLAPKHASFTFGLETNARSA